MMPNPDGHYLAIVRDPTTGEPVDWARNLSYDMVVNFPHGPVDATGIVPSLDRWTLTKVQAIKPGTPIMVSSVRGQLQIMGRELPHAEECPAPGGTSRSATTHIRELLATVRAMSWSEKAELRRALEGL